MPKGFRLWAPTAGHRHPHQASCEGRHRRAYGTGLVQPASLRGQLRASGLPTQAKPCRPRRIPPPAHRSSCPLAAPPPPRPAAAAGAGTAAARGRRATQPGCGWPRGSCQGMGECRGAGRQRGDLYQRVATNEGVNVELGRGWSSRTRAIAACSATRGCATGASAMRPFPWCSLSVMRPRMERATLAPLLT